MSNPRGARPVTPSLGKAVDSRDDDPSPSSRLERDTSRPPSSPETRRPSSSVGRTSLRRQNTSSRIEEILEIGLQRAETYAAARESSPVPTTESLSHVTTWPLSAHLPAMSPNETTRIVAHSDSSLNYNTNIHSQLSDRRPGRQLPGDTRDDADAGADHEHLPAPQPRWYKSILSQFQSLELENKGSVARDHLAIERTFLAWLRTSLAFASIGIAVTQLFRLNTSLGDVGDGNTASTLRHVGQPLGAAFLAISILILFLGYHRYSQSQRWVIEGKFPASRGTIIIVSLVAFGLMITSLAVVIVVNPTDKEL